MSVEFFFVGAKIDRPSAERFTGTKLIAGYQIGYPGAPKGGDCGVEFSQPDLGRSQRHRPGIVPNLTLDLTAGGTAGIGGNIVPSQFELALVPGGISDVTLRADKSFKRRGSFGAVVLHSRICARRSLPGHHSAVRQGGDFPRRLCRHLRRSSTSPVLGHGVVPAASFIPRMAGLRMPLRCRSRKRMRSRERFRWHSQTAG
ncbi:MspA family porin (plasmid) [Rhodococcus qingshengii]